MRILIKQARVIDPANQIDAHLELAIADGRIQQIGQTITDFTPDQIIAAHGQVVCPGLIDLRAHLREPGQEHKATIASECHAAARSGITTLVCSPDTQPVVDTPAVATLIRDKAGEAGMSRVLPLGALTQGLDGSQLSELQALKAAGCIGVSNEFYPMANLLVLRRALEYAATFDLTVFVNAEDASLRNDGCVHEGAVSTRLGLPGIPATAETVAVASWLALIQETGVRAHFTQLSTVQAVRQIARARHDGLAVTAAVSAHHLHLTEIDVLDFDSHCHVRPPLRTQRDCDGLREGLRDGTITAICSDHQPHEEDAKLAPFSCTAPGISALDTLLPLSLAVAERRAETRTSTGVIHASQLGIQDIIRCLTAGPAAILGSDRGNLSIGAPADICIFNPQTYWPLTAERMHSRGKNSPFLNWEMSGQVTATLIDGRIAYQSKPDNHD